MKIRGVAILEPKREDVDAIPALEGDELAILQVLDNDTVPSKNDSVASFANRGHRDQRLGDICNLEEHCCLVAILRASSQMLLT